MKARMFLGVLAVMGILALSATAAQAGAGGTPVPLVSFFVCNPINGDSSDKVVDVESNRLGPGRQSVKIGNGAFACATAKLFDAAGDEIPPTSENALGEELKCYSISVSRKTSSPQGQIPPRYNAIDTLVGSEENIQVSEIKYICGPSSFTLSP